MLKAGGPSSTTRAEVGWDFGAHLLKTLSGALLRFVGDVIVVDGGFEASRNVVLVLIGV